MESRLAADYERNRKEFDFLWSRRFRYSLTYSTQTKLRRFRELMRRRGLLHRDGLRVFEQGFGLGLMLFSFLKSCELAGLELSPTAVSGAAKIASRKGFRSVDFRVYEPGKPYPAEWRERFDLVISSHVLEHLQDPLGALEELVMLLRPGGFACFLIPINESPGEDLNHFSHFTEEHFCRLVVGAGLRIESAESCDRLYCVIKPLSMRLQRHPTTADRILSVGLNLVLGRIPAPFLRRIDNWMAYGRWEASQCLMFACKPE
ncbi:MAG: class I SAM-dependent methyltransferase [Deltaproteobacteria bacterium]|nr:class I SAM-dependent methyltransferase [Candidatus Deferrimicrobium borealis]